MPRQLDTPICRQTEWKATMSLDLSRHPCFNDKARHRFGRIHLPVAPKCNIQCNFCNRKSDCANESRPGVTSAILSPGQAIHYLDQVIEKSPNIAVVGIAGPGDPFANADATMETLERVRAKYPEMLLCVASNGLNVAPFAERLARLQVSHVTLTINAVDPQIGAEVYGWVRYGKRAFRGIEGARLLLDRQLESLRALKQHGVTVKVNTIIIPGVNDDHVAEVARTVAELGADICNCIAICPVEGTPLGDVQPPSDDEVAAIRTEAGEFMPLMHHCTRCRADAVGLLGQAMPTETLNILRESSAMPLDPEADKPCVAVATREGMLVNMHLGEAQELHVYRETDGDYEFIETRTTPERGDGDKRWFDLAGSLRDCRAVLVTSAGNAPQTILAQAGIRVVMMEGLVDEGLEAVYANRPLRAPLRRSHQCGAGAGCAGDGTGCG